MVAILFLPVDIFTILQLVCIWDARNPRRPLCTVKKKNRIKMKINKIKKTMPLYIVIFIYTYKL